MEDEFIENKGKRGSRFPIIVFVVSIAIIAMGLLMSRGNHQFFKDARMTMGTAHYQKVTSSTRKEVKWEVYVDYTVDGKDYHELLKSESSKSSTFASNYDKDVVIYYNPENPREIKDKSSNHAGIIIITFGTVLCALVTLDYAIGKVKERKNTELKQGYEAMKELNNNLNELEQKNQITQDNK